MDDQNSPAPGSSRRQKRSAVACSKCRLRKIRCDVSHIGVPCSNCVHDRAICKAPLNKGKPYVSQDLLQLWLLRSNWKVSEQKLGSLCRAYCLECQQTPHILEETLLALPDLVRASQVLRVVSRPGRANLLLFKVVHLVTARKVLHRNRPALWRKTTSLASFGTG